MIFARKYARSISLRKDAFASGPWPSAETEWSAFKSLAPKGGGGRPWKWSAFQFLRVPSTPQGPTPVWPKEEFRPRAGVGGNPQLIPLLSLTEEEQFHERFRLSPIRRTKRRGLLRNVCVALGNSGDRQAVPALIGALDDYEPLIRSHAAWALGRLGGQPAKQALQNHYKQKQIREV